jgi:excisionase family DNA binding protein
MPAKRINPNRVKIHYSYTPAELAKRLGVHKNTIRNWTRDGLQPLAGRPILFHGGSVRAFLAASNADRRKPCPPGTFYCFRCRERRAPALGMVDFMDRLTGAGYLTAVCEACGAIMNRRARRETLPTIMPGLAVQIREAPLTLKGSLFPSVNCASKEREPV